MNTYFSSLNLSWYLHTNVSNEEEKVWEITEVIPIQNKKNCTGGKKFFQIFFTWIPGSGKEEENVLG